MSKVLFEPVSISENTGINLSFMTVPGGYSPLHWHYELEILYPLNGSADIIIDGITHELKKRQLMVIETCQIHSIHYYQPASMFVCIQISKKALRKYMPDIELYQIHCHPEKITDNLFSAYIESCQFVNQLIRLYMEESETFRLEAEGIVLQLLARLLHNFSIKHGQIFSAINSKAMERLLQVIEYVGIHYQELISLDTICSLLCLNKEYFCRFFKKNMGITFLQYLNEVRITHIYQELVETSEPIQFIIEKNGFTNQKLFNHTFKKIYGYTPSSVRKAKIKDL